MNRRRLLVAPLLFLLRAASPPVKARTVRSPSAQARVVQHPNCRSVPVPVHGPAPIVPDAVRRLDVPIDAAEVDRIAACIREQRMADGTYVPPYDE